MHESHDVNTLFEIRPVKLSMKNMELGNVTNSVEDTELPFIANSTIRSSINKQMTLTEQHEESESLSLSWSVPPETVRPYTARYADLGILHAKGTVPFTAHWEDDWPATTGNLQVHTYTQHTHVSWSKTLFGEMEKLAPYDIK